MGKYIMAFDAGTTSSRAVIYDRKGNMIAMSQKGFEQLYPEDGWVEQDPNEIWETQVYVARDALKKANLSYKDIDSIGITNQRETTIVWNKETGEPVYRAIVWQCRRTADYCNSLEQEGLKEMIQSKTGLIIDPYFSGTKIRWILENVEGARALAEEGKLCFGTVETWLIWKLTGGKAHVTDYSNASRTMIFNIHDLKWDEELLALLDIPKPMLPKPVQSSEIYGESLAEIFGGPIRIAGAAGDQQCALFGQTCFKEGEAKNTYGTGAFLLMNIGEKAICSEKGLLTTIAWGLNGKVTYALEGSVFVCAGALHWLRDGLNIFEHSAESEAMALSVPDSKGVYMVPAFVGLGAPYWDPYARGAVLGITRDVNKNHLVRATLESIAFQVRDLIDAMEVDLVDLKVDGGASANNLLLQMQADFLNKEVVRPTNIETTSLGAAYLAGLATGYYKDTDEILENWQVSKRFSPQMDENSREKALAGWHKAVEKCKDWAL
ncbi:MAG: glycerol kinase GlpK [Clostridia bacterium]|nr:glycerol kinase GlpK [Clostridia bacterium]